MRRLTKTKFTIVLSIMAMILCVLGLTFIINSATATGGNLSDTKIYMQDVSIRINVNHKMGEIDEDALGIKFTAKVENVDESVSYGIVVVPKSEITGEIDAQNLLMNARAVKTEVSAERVKKENDTLFLAITDFSEIETDDLLTAVPYFRKGSNYVVGTTMDGCVVEEVSKFIANKNQDNSIKAMVLETYCEKASESEYEKFVGNYAGTYTFNADGTVTKRDLDNYEFISCVYNGSDTGLVGQSYNYAGHHPVVSGEYDIYQLNGTKYVSLSFEDGTKSMDTDINLMADKVDLDAIYEMLQSSAFSGTVNGSKKTITFTSEVNTEFGDGWFSGRGTIPNSWGFSYRLIPIGVNYGKIETVYNDTTSWGLYDYGRSAHEIYYVIDGDKISLRVGEGVYSRRYLHIGYNHFVDFTADGKAITDEVYDVVKGEYGTALKLNGLSTDLVGYDKNKVEQTAKFTGGTGSFNGKAITYSLVKIAEDNGLIFIDMTATPQLFANREDTSTFVKGVYNIEGEKTTVIFIYNGTEYSFTK